MSSCGSDWMLCEEDKVPISSVAVSLLETISEIIASMEYMEVKNPNLVEIGSYLYRVSAFVMELQNSSSDATSIMQSLSKSIDWAKELVSRCQKRAEVRSSTEQLEGVIKLIGEDLDSIPPSTYGNQEFVETAVTSLSKEMKSFHIEVTQMSQIQVPEKKELEPQAETDLYSLSSQIQVPEKELEPQAENDLYSISSQIQVPEKKELEPQAETDSYSLSSQIQVTEKELEPQAENGLYSISSQIQVPEKKELELQAETDLYSISSEGYTESVQSFGFPRLNQSEQFGSTNIRGKWSQRKGSTGSSTNFPHVTQYMEPQYETFFCPLTKSIMDDPVTIETGVTYERKAITEWYEKFESPSDVVCPKTGQKLLKRNSSTNMALKATIEEWKERNEMARINVAMAALSLASSERKVIEALKDLQIIICHRKRNKKLLMPTLPSMGMLPLIGNFLDYKDRNVSCATLELLLLLAEDDDQGKEMVAMSVNMPTIVRLLSSDHQPVKHKSLLLLLELSRSQSLCEKIGSVTGGILMLIATKYRENSDAFASDKADEILRNLEASPDNIKRMADNGLVEPLLNHLIEGNEEIKMEMASYLGEISLWNECQIQVAERACPCLLKMVHDGNSLTRKAAFKALKQISSHHPNTKVLVEAGIVRFVAEELFTRNIYNEQMNSKKEAAAILADVLESGLDPESIQVNLSGHTLASAYIVYNIIYSLLENSTPDELNINLIRALLCLTKSQKVSGTIVSVVKETEASYNLMELINSANEELGVLAVKLLIKLSPYIGHILVERLCEIRGQPENLIQSPTDTTRITKKQAVSANFLAKLPQKSLTLNLALLNKNLVPAVLETISQMQRSGVRTSRYGNYYFEGLVGILVRFTTTLYDHQVLLLARNNNFTSLFTELLTKTSSDEVQRLSAIGLENLSTQTISLSKPPKVKKSKYIKLPYLPKCAFFVSSKHKSKPLCPVHRGACSSQDTFCLLDAKAVERLLACLDHENVEVVGAALSAICTLLDDNVDVEKSVGILNEVNTIQFVLNAVREHKHDDLWQKSFWVIERFLMRGGSVSDLSQDGLLLAAFVSAFHHGDGSTQQMAENILRCRWLRTS